MELLSRSKLPTAFSETLDTRDLAREMIFLRLRTVEGVDEEELYKRTGYRFRREDNKDLVDSFLMNGLLHHTPPFWRPTRKGLQYADGMAVDCTP
jgi:coproporphyrinogen III oxidase-like Fe-S oxidoreductase